MPMFKETAFDILGLPTFASKDEILNRYKTLALACFPGNHHNPEVAIHEFRSINEAAVRLLFAEKPHCKMMTLAEMYAVFQCFFFRGSSRPPPEEYLEDNTSEASTQFDMAEAIFEAEEIKADDKANELIYEEERDKLKAEKRKAKKKRRKERKKQEKKQQQEMNGSEKKDTSGGKSSKQSKQKKQDSASSESEEELDTTSAFVAIIAKKHKKLQDLDVKEKKEPPKKPPELTQEEREAIIMHSRQLALQGNELASSGCYVEAVEYFTESIRLDPSDHRFYGNRSYCYDRLGQFDRALKDADKSISLSPTWPKGYFRKGRALLGLKKFASSEKFFIEVLKRDVDCDDAITELRKARLAQIMDKGYSRESAETALSLTQNHTVQEALDWLVAQRVSLLKVKEEIDVFMSDDEGPRPPPKPAVKKKPTPQAPQQPYDIKMDPNNPEGHVSLWIGNVQTDVTEKKLINLFSKYGELVSVRVMPEKYCAFVNYKHKSSPGKAMKAYQGFELSGSKLLIKFPNAPGESQPSKKKPVIVTANESKVLGPVNGYECYFWRNAGCTNGGSCRYQHVKEHKGIDLKKK